MMKKITFLFTMLFVFASSWQGMAQTLNQPANWPNATWSVTTIATGGTQDIEAYPSADANFAYDDDDTGSSSHDEIMAESPIIDLTAAHTAGETILTVSGDYVFNNLDNDEYLGVDYWDADASSWTTIIQLANADTSSAPTNNYCSGTAEAYTSDLDISSFNATQLSGFKYRFYYNDDTTGGTAWNYGFCFSSPTLVSSSPPSCEAPTNLVVSSMTAPSTATLSWDAVTGASGYNCEIQPQGTAQGTAGAVASINITNGATTSFSATTLVGGTDYTLYVQTDCGGGDTSTYSSLDFTFAPPPANDDCSAAVALSCDDSLTSQTTLGATGGSSTSCQGSIGDDVWYSFVGNDAEVTITVDSTTGGEQAQIDIYASSDGTCAGFTQGTCDPSLVQSSGGSDPYSATFDAVVGTTYFIAVGNWINGDLGFNFDLTVTCVTCPAPSNLTTTDITYTTASIDWTENGGATLWNIEYKAGADFTPGNGEQDQTGSFAAHPYGLAGFQPNTTYYWYVQADCGGGDTSEWVGASFTTACTSVTSYPFIEEFEGNVEPDCWSEERIGTTSYGWISNSDGYAGNCARFDSWLNGNGNTSSMFSKVFDLTSLADPQLSFYFKNPTGGDFTVSISSDGGTSYTVLETGLTGQTDWLQKTYDITSYISDTVIIEFKGTSNYGSGDAYVYLDNVEITYTTLGIANQTIQGFNMFPNPVSNTLYLNAQEQIDAVSIYNMLGQEVLRNTPSATQVQLDMSNLPTGTYIVKVQAGNQLGTYNLIKQ